MRRDDGALPRDASLQRVRVKAMGGQLGYLLHFGQVNEGGMVCQGVVCRIAVGCTLSSVITLTEWGSGNDNDIRGQALSRVGNLDTTPTAHSFIARERLSRPQAVSIDSASLFTLPLCSTHPKPHSVLGPRSRTRANNHGGCQAGILSPLGNSINRTRVHWGESTARTAGSV